MLSNINDQFNPAITQEQLSEIIEAILNGKYSWACVLMLKSAGYNPLHYIPYRTFNRLIKANSLPPASPSGSGQRLKQQTMQAQMAQTGTQRIRDLNYLEPAANRCGSPQGGYGAIAWQNWQSFSETFDWRTAT
ncbi:MAG: HetP family heterocyst commitment protein [Leptolyngbya sp. SIO4C1]|nr:HetP family heterocyst commitment protein [Leptolyngbya sp. SIO4C1]